MGGHMEFKCCPNCGAGLNLTLEFCEYCLSPFNKHHDYRTNTTKYEWGWVDPREIYGFGSTPVRTHRPTGLTGILRAIGGG